MPNTQGVLQQILAGALQILHIYKILQVNAVCIEANAVVRTLFIQLVLRLLQLVLALICVDTVCIELNAVGIDTFYVSEDAIGIEVNAVCCCRHCWL